MHNLEKYQQVVFDCDGVILDSNDVKSAAFAKSLEGEDQKLIDKFLFYHRENGGVSRFVKFEYFFKIIKSQKNYQNDLKNVLEKYSRLSYEGLLDCEEVKGIRNLLIKLSNHNIECFVVSGGEQNEVRKVLEKRNLSPYFKMIFGSPKTKQENLAIIQPNNSIYFGDAKGDYEAAIASGMDFIYISENSEWKDGMRFCHTNGVAVLENFTKLNNLIQ